MLPKLRNPLLAAAVSLALTAFLTAPATAAMLGGLASAPDPGRPRGEELSRIQRALETEIVRSGLEAHGLTPGEALERLQAISDEQLHLMAQASDRVLAGGDGGEVVVAVLLIILLVLLILYLQGKKVVIR
ncbi:MAG: PA2779 family protein [Syntrophobacterales bacterium]|nr:PA2779 family protein [Syntrophobacterales bacterium]